MEQQNKIKKIAVIFPGIGYTMEKPLLYYSGKLAKRNGYALEAVTYSDSCFHMGADKKEREDAYTCMLAQVTEQLKAVQWEEYQQILFISKSIGTVLAGRYVQEQKLSATGFFWTPLEDACENLHLFHKKLVVFGTADPWVDSEKLRTFCTGKEIGMLELEGANHSLETGDVWQDLTNLERVLKQFDVWLSETQD